MAFDRIIYFGDSLTDSDEFFALASQLLAFPLPSSVFGYDGQFSNGDVYADIAPRLLGIEADESVNYAVGGARAVGENLLGAALAASPLALPDPDPALLAFDSNLGGQIGRFLGDVPGLGDLSGSAASFFIGLNDFNGLASTIDPENFDPVTFAAEAQALAAQVAQSTLVAAGAAAQAGVGTIILNTLPVGSFFPLTDFLPAEVIPLADELVRGFNDALIAGSANISALGVEVRIVDFEAIADEVVTDGQTFGFLDTQNAFLLGTGADPTFVDPDGPGPLPPQPFFAQNPALDGLEQDQFAFYDLLHPTTAMHGVLGAFQAATLSNDTTDFLGDGNDRARLDNGDNLVFGQGGDDRLILRRGDDVAFGGTGDDWISGGRGSDIASGGSGDDWVAGGRGNDVVAGNTGDDILFGGRGDDALIDGLGSDKAFGGRGNDTFFYAEASLIGGTTGADRDLFVGGRGYDTLYLVVSDENRAAVEAEIADPGWCFGHNFADLGLRTFGIEEIVLLDSRAEFDAVTVAAGLQTTLDEAEAWGLV